MALASYDDILNNATVSGNVYRLPFRIQALSQNEGAGVHQSFWSSKGQPALETQAPASTPGTVYNSLAGAITFPDTAPNNKYLTSVSLTSEIASNLFQVMLYDRLAAVGSVSLASTGNKTINSGALNRYTGTDSPGNEVWLEVTTALTTTAPVINLASYTNQAGTNNQVGGSVTYAGAININTFTMVQLPLADGDTGVRSVETLNVGTAAAAGVASLVIMRRLATFTFPSAIPATGACVQDFIQQVRGLTRIYDGATLFWVGIYFSAGNIGGLGGIITAVRD